MIFGPLQIALLEMVIDPVCALVFEAGREESQAMRRAPRRPDERLFSTRLIRSGLLQGLLALGVAGAIAVGAGGSCARPDLVFLRLAGGHSGAGSGQPVVQRAAGPCLLRQNLALRYVAAFVTAGCGLVLGIAPIRTTLGFAVPIPLDMAVIVVSGMGLLVLIELGKRLEKG